MINQHILRCNLYIAVDVTGCLSGLPEKFTKYRIKSQELAALLVLFHLGTLLCVKYGWECKIARSSRAIRLHLASRPLMISSSSFHCPSQFIPKLITRRGQYTLVGPHLGPLPMQSRHQYDPMRRSHSISTWFFWRASHSQAFLVSTLLHGPLVIFSSVMRTLRNFRC